MHSLSDSAAQAEHRFSTVLSFSVQHEFKGLEVLIHREWLP
jgi:hypothetical protein